MKRTVLASLLVVCTIVSNAQTIVPRAGLTISTVNISEEDEDAEVKSSLGFTIGAGFDIPVNEMFSVQPELNFIQKGFKIDESYTEQYDGYEYSEEAEIKVTINYLELPVLAKASFGSDTKFFLVAGPSIGIGLGGKAKEKYSYTQKLDGEVLDSESESITMKVKFGDAPENEDEDDVYFENRIDLGLQFGAGVLVKNRVSIEARYGLGLSSLTEDIDVMNRVFQFSVAMPLSLGK